QRLAHWDRHDLAGALDLAALFDALIRAEQHRTDGGLLQVERHTVLAVRELDELTGHALIQPIHPCDAVAYLDHGADVVELNLVVIVLDLFFDDTADLIWSQLHVFTNLLTPGPI